MGSNPTLSALTRCAPLPRGEVTEWFKVLAWKASVGLNLPGVRIPLSPPFFTLVLLNAMDGDGRVLLTGGP